MRPKNLHTNLNQSLKWRKKDNPFLLYPLSLKFFFFCELANCYHPCACVRACFVCICICKYDFSFLFFVLMRYSLIFLGTGKDQMQELVFFLIFAIICSGMFVG
ncbi:hypothetical protein Pfo_011445 [Paulownia fortunei]|nr:hypothetical protein Pfo_011445 [Paulownia fortunei]